MKGKLELLESENVLRFISENGVKILNLCQILKPRELAVCRKLKSLVF